MPATQKTRHHWRRRRRRVLHLHLSRLWQGLALVMRLVKRQRLRRAARRHAVAHRNVQVVATKLFIAYLVQDARHAEADLTLVQGFAHLLVPFQQPQPVCHVILFAPDRAAHARNVLFVLLVELREVKRLIHGRNFGAHQVLRDLGGFLGSFVRAVHLAVHLPPAQPQRRQVAGVTKADLIALPELAHPNGLELAHQGEGFLELGNSVIANLCPHRQRRLVNLRQRQLAEFSQLGPPPPSAPAPRTPARDNLCAGVRWDAATARRPHSAAAARRTPRTRRFCRVATCAQYLVSVSLASSWCWSIGHSRE